MNKENIKLWSEVTFKTRCYRKNYDFIVKNEHIITEYDGTVLKLRIGEKKLPMILGEYNFSIWNIKLGNELGINIPELLNNYQTDLVYRELSKLDVTTFNINNYDRVLLIHSFILTPEYRKTGVTEEFIESLYRDFGGDNTAIIALVIPFQDNNVDSDYYLNKKSVEIIQQHSNEVSTISAFEYYSLDELYNKTDREYNLYKLYAVASRCGFNRLSDSNMFLLNPDIVLERLKEKLTHN